MATAIEYGLIAALIGVAAVAAVSGLADYDSTELPKQAQVELAFAASDFRGVQASLDRTKGRLSNIAVNACIAAKAKNIATCAQRWEQMAKDGQLDDGVQ